MLVRGLEAAVISVIVRIREPTRTGMVTRLEVLAMAVGVVFETAGFFALDWYLFGWAVALTVLPTIVDAVFIPVAVGVVVAVRRRLGVIWLT
ncbi:hypothetical protein JXL21_04385, partial [Candidatus Bathyarchaeota archaeon]|nr:hypothetical protein [Candidatus Bathyarchaeota archaeon]